MIGEFAILPRALRENSYPDPDLARVCLQRLYDCIRNEAVARNLAGKWAESVRSQSGLHPCAREILEHLAKVGRLVPDQMTFPRVPGCDLEWLDAALNSHNKSPLDLIVTRGREPKDPPLPAVASDIKDLDRSIWSRNSSGAIRVEPTMDGYLKSLSQIAKLSRRLVIIDPFLNPEERNYAEFPRLLIKLIELNRGLFIEIHVKDNGSKHARIKPFEDALRTIKWNGEFQLHVWDKFHDRYVISNLVGISMQRGLEFGGSKKGELLVWNRLTSEIREQKLKDVDPTLQKWRRLEFNTVKGTQTPVPRTD